jgi:CRP/FNR family cyclic AMP-dependent transcriptional regulator
MTLDELLLEVPEFSGYIKNMPADIKDRCSIRVIPPGQIIHQKNFLLNYFAFVVKGSHRVINEFENGNIYMIEKNEAINFVGEVTILAEQERTSVTLETITECILYQMSRKDFERWIKQDIELLYLISTKVAFKLYRSSSRSGATLFYPPSFLLLEYLVQYADKHLTGKKTFVTVPFTRTQLEEELGINIKTLNRTIKKLKDTGFIGILKGKLTFSRQQYDDAVLELSIMRRGGHRW